MPVYLNSSTVYISVTLKLFFLHIYLKEKKKRKKSKSSWFKGKKNPKLSSILRKCLEKHNTSRERCGNEGCNQAGFILTVRMQWELYQVKYAFLWNMSCRHAEKAYVGTTMEFLSFLFYMVLYFPARFSGSLPCLFHLLTPKRGAWYSSSHPKHLSHFSGKPYMQMDKQGLKDQIII